MEKVNTINLSEIRNSLQENENSLTKEEIKNKCLIIKSANDWLEEAKNRPMPKQLFGEIWFENELSILYADTNVGKSILAVQIANSISSGKPILNMANEVIPQKILYIDCELSDKQFENRYSIKYQQHYQFHTNFDRAEINSDLEIPNQYKSLEVYLAHSLEQHAINGNYKIFIIDNLSYLSNDNEKAKDALHLMKQLKNLTRNHDASVLVLAHTPKRDETKPIHKNDLAGSKMLMNFCDSSFSIGNSCLNPNYRYIKQIKQRNTEHKYHWENIILCELEKPENFVKLNFLAYDMEINHLKTFSNTTSEDKDIQILELINQGLNNVEIGKELGMSEGAIRKRKKKLNL